MPTVGDIVPGKEIGKSSTRYIWARCPDCGEERWVPYKPHDPGSSRRCKPCHIKHVSVQFKRPKAER